MVILKFMKLETLFTTALTLLGLGIVYTAVQYGFGSLREPGPGFFPCFIGLLVVIFGMILLIPRRQDKKEPKLFDNRDGAWRFWLAAGSLVVWLLLLNPLGFLIITFVVTLADAKVFKLEGWVKPVLLAAGTTLMIFLLFDVWFYTDLPRGLLD
jgi:hypothetical protein